MAWVCVPVRKAGEIYGRGSRPDVAREMETELPAGPAGQRERALAEAAEEGADVLVRGASGEEASARADVALAVLGQGARRWASAGVRSGPCGA